MIQYVRNFQKFRPLLGELVMRDVKIKYRNLYWAYSGHC